MSVRVNAHAHSETHTHVHTLLLSHGAEQCSNHVEAGHTHIHLHIHTQSCMYTCTRIHAHTYTRTPKPHRWADPLTHVDCSEGDRDDDPLQHTEDAPQGGALKCDLCGRGGGGGEVCAYIGKFDNKRHSVCAEQPQDKLGLASAKERQRLNEHVLACPWCHVGEFFVLIIPPPTHTHKPTQPPTHIKRGAHTSKYE